jgi:hypothetical protein
MALTSVENAPLTSRRGPLDGALGVPPRGRGVSPLIQAPARTRGRKQCGRFWGSPRCLPPRPSMCFAHRAPSSGPRSARRWCSKDGRDHRKISQYRDLRIGCLTDSEFCWRGLSDSKSDGITAYSPQEYNGYGSEPRRALVVNPRRSETTPPRLAAQQQFPVRARHAVVHLRFARIWARTSAATFARPCSSME